jgi:hypothetical protein
VPGGGLGRLPARGQAVRALAVTARATAALVAAGSARMTTRAPVIVLAVSPGAIQMTRQPEAARRVMSFCPSACWVPLYRPSETGYVREFGNHLFVTDDRTRIPPGSMFASLDRILLRRGSEALTSADDPRLVGAP